MSSGDATTERCGPAASQGRDHRHLRAASAGSSRAGCTTSSAGSIVGLDRRPMPGRPKDIEHHQVDLRSKKARDVFRAGDVDALVHLGVMHDPRARPAEHLLLERHRHDEAARVLPGVSRAEGRAALVARTSTARAPTTRSSSPRTRRCSPPSAFPQMRDLVEIDHLVSTFLWRARETETVILRPVHIVGPVHNAPSNYLRIAAPADAARLRSDGAARPRR